MIINYDSPGQLCNRIWSLLPSVAYGLEYNEKILIINFEEYSKYFENLNINNLVSFTSRKFLKCFFKSLKVKDWIENGKPNIFLKLFNLNLIEGWSNRSGNSRMVQKQSDNIRDIFTFKKEITSPADEIFSLFTGQPVVGVHIRRGDYKEWLDGIYYYTDEDYYHIMKIIQAQLLQDGEKTKFFLCSDEKIDLNYFHDLDCFTMPDSSCASDLYALSKCTFLIGPPSTYSQWASFWGKVPVKFIMSINEKIMLSDFSEIVAFNKFENGKELVID